MTDPDPAGGRGSILVVEDEAASADFVAALLAEEGFRPHVVADAIGAIQGFQTQRPVAVLIDWVLVGVSGLEVCRQIRAQDSLVPIFFITGRDDEASVSRALDAGADDFLVKPFRPRELVARLDAHLRKVAAMPPAGATIRPEPGAPVGDVRRFGDVEVDLEARTASLRGAPVALGPLEFRLLEYFVRNPGIALSRDQILLEVHGYDQIPTERVDLLVRRLRAKLDWTDWIVAVPAYGYRLERPAK